jgi:hypothetical protein
MVMTKNFRRPLLMCIAAVATFAACDRDPLVAPVASTIGLTAQTTLLRPGESTELTAIVTEEAGTAVHNGTEVRFLATLGRVEPERAKTEDGVAKATFTAGNILGTARITALSGAAEPNVDLPNIFDIVIEN